MTVIFKDIHRDKTIIMENVKQLVNNDKLFSTVGYGLYFMDNTFCVLDNESYKLISINCDH